jgi:hypothetical protein
LSSTRPTVVLSAFNSWVRPVIPALRTTSFAINQFNAAIIAADRFKSNVKSETRGVKREA